MIIKDNFISILESAKSNTINNKYNDYFNNLNKNLDKISNFIIYGPAGIGKYSEALKLIENYSPSKLKYEKKMTIDSKNEHTIKISDIHYEIDFQNLTCNSKILLNDIYNNIIDVIHSNKDKKGIILCKNFHDINNELLEVFYSYMQKNLIYNITLKFIIITEHLSFIPENIQDVCNTLYYTKLSYSNYIKISNTNNKKFLLNKQNKLDYNFISNISSINQLKYIDLTEENENIVNLKLSICNKIINYIFNKNINYNNLRNILYDILIYNLNIYDSIFTIIILYLKKYQELNVNKLDKDLINKIFIKTCILFKYYNNNYRPIYHLEAFILYLIKLIT